MTVLARCVLAAIVLLAACAVAGAKGPGASGGNPRDFPAGQRTISLSPALQQASVDAGSRLTLHATVRNATLLDLSFRADVRDAGGSSAREGGVEVIPAGTGSRGAAEWIRVQGPRFDVASGDERDLVIEVEVPADAAPGGYYAALVLGARPPKDAAITIESQISSIVLLTVRGRVRHDLQSTVTPVRRIRGGTPLEWRVRLENRGNVHETIAGSLVVDPAIGGGGRLRLRQAILLPDVVQVQVLRADVRSVPNLVHAHLELKRSDGTTLTRAAPWMIVLPWWLLIVALVLALLWWWRRRRRAVAWGDDGVEEHFGL